MSLFGSKTVKMLYRLAMPYNPGRYGSGHQSGLFHQGPKRS